MTPVLVKNYVPFDLQRFTNSCHLLFSVVRAPAVISYSIQYEKKLPSRSVNRRLTFFPRRDGRVLTHDFLVKTVKGIASINIPADSAVVVVVCPTNGRISHQDNKTLINGVVLDYGNLEERQQS